MSVHVAPGLLDKDHCWLRWLEQELWGRIRVAVNSPQNHWSARHVLPPSMADRHRAWIGGAAAAPAAGRLENYNDGSRSRQPSGFPRSFCCGLFAGLLCRYMTHIAKPRTLSCIPHPLLSTHNSPTPTNLYLGPNCMWGEKENERWNHYKDDLLKQKENKNKSKFLVLSMCSWLSTEGVIDAPSTPT